MQTNERIVRYIAAEIDEMVRRGEDRTNYARLDAMTEEELEASIDHDEEGDADRSVVYVGIPGLKRFTLAVDPDVADWFQAQDGNARTRMNAVLRAHMKSHQS